MSDGTDLIPDVPDEARAFARASEEWSKMLLTQAKVKVLVASGVFPDLKSVAIGMTKAWAGEPFGLDAFASQTAFDLINGKVEANANLHAAMVKRHPKYDYRITSHDNQGCVIAFYQREGEDWVHLGDSSFTIKDAELAGLLKNAVWKSYPRSMTFARAMTNGVGWYCPDVMAFRTYSQGEISGNERPPELPSFVPYAGSSIPIDVSGTPKDSVVEVSGLDDTTDEPEGEGVTALTPSAPSPEGSTVTAEQVVEVVTQVFEDAVAEEDEEKHTPAQMKKIRAIQSSLGWSDERLREYAKVESMASLTKHQAHALIESMVAMESWKAQEVASK